jgi:GDSL-like Lipase/Acylhydrolase family
MGRIIQFLLHITMVAIAITLLSGCPTQTKRVLIFGDSITYASSGNISNVGGNVMDEDPGNRIVYTIIATSGIGARRTWGEPGDPDEYWFSLISNSIRPGSFDAIVVELGTNDCHLLSSTGDYIPDIQRITDAISASDPNVPIFWLTVPDYSHLPDCAPIINGDLEGIVQSGIYPNLKTLDYGAWAEAHQDCFYDGVHLREGWRKDPESGGASKGAPPDYCNGQFEYASWLKAQHDTYFGPPSS